MLNDRVQTQMGQFDEKPLYLQVEERIQRMISQKELMVGDAIPGRNVLCQEFAVSDLTVRKAISHLVQQGVLVTRQGRGTFVASNPNIKKLLFVCGVDVFGSDVSSFYTHFLCSCQEEALRNGLTLKPIWLSGDNLEEAYSYCNANALRGFEGVIFIGCPLSHPLYRYVKSERINNVVVTHEQPGPKRITVNHGLGITKAIDYLHASDDDGIMIVCNKDLYGKVKEIADRDKRVTRIVTMASLSRTAECEADGYHLMQHLLQGDDVLSGIIFLDNIVARGASRAVLEAGLSDTPKWVVLSGLQEILPLGFPVAYVTLDTNKKAKETIRILVDELENRVGQPDYYDEQPMLLSPDMLQKHMGRTVRSGSYDVHDCMVK